MSCDQEKEKKYTAFMVNAIKPLTYLLDINFNDEKEELKYKNAKIETYRFKDYKKLTVKEIIEGKQEEPQEQERSLYRCRIYGIGKIDQKMSGLSFSEYNKKLQQAKIRMVHEINPTDGWVYCSMDHIDCHNRLIVKIYDIITQKPLNLILLNDEFKKVFNVYHPDSRRNMSQFQGRFGYLQKPIYYSRQYDGTDKRNFINAPLDLQIKNIDKRPPGIDILNPSTLMFRRGVNNFSSCNLRAMRILKNRRSLS